MSKKTCWQETTNICYWLFYNQGCLATELLALILNILWFVFFFFLAIAFKNKQKSFVHKYWNAAIKALFWLGWMLSLPCSKLIKNKDQSINAAEQGISFYSAVFLHICMYKANFWPQDLQCCCIISFTLHSILLSCVGLSKSYWVHSTKLIYSVKSHTTRFFPWV